MSSSHFLHESEVGPFGDDARAPHSNGLALGVRSILVATNLSDHDSHAMRAAMLAEAHGATLVLLHVLTYEPAQWRSSSSAKSRAFRAEAAMATLAARIRRHHEVTVSTQVRPGSLREELLRESRHVDLVVLAAKGQHPMKRLLGGTPSRLLRTCDRPMLTVKAPPKGPYRRVLVPADLIDGAEASLYAAAALSPRGEVHLLHALEVPYEGKLRYAGVSDEGIQRHLVAAKTTAQSHLSAMLAPHRQSLPRFHVSVRHGRAIRVSLDQEARIGADLIIMRKRSKSAAEDLLLGSTTRRVLLDSACDVLVMPASAPKGVDGSWWSRGRVAER